MKDTSLSARRALRESASGYAFILPQMIGFFLFCPDSAGKCVHLLVPEPQHALWYEQPHRLSKLRNAFPGFVVLPDAEKHADLLRFSGAAESGAGAGSGTVSG